MIPATPGLLKSRLIEKSERFSRFFLDIYPGNTVPMVLRP